MMKKIQDPAALERALQQANIPLWFDHPEKIKFSLTQWEKGEHLCSPPGKMEDFVFLLSGTVLICSFSESGKIVVLTQNRAPYFLGAQEFLFPDSEQNWAIAGTRMTGVTCSIEGNRALLEQDLHFHRQLCFELSKKLVYSSDSRKEQSLYTGEERLLQYLYAVAKPDGTLSVRWTEVAQRMDVSYRNLMYLLRRLCDDGILQHSGRGSYRLMSGQKRT